MATPTADEARTNYLGPDSEHHKADVDSAFAAERAAQAHRCRVPDDDADWPADLIEALYRRVATNLANRGLPLAIQTSYSDVGGGFARVGGLDPEVRRLEAPYRKVVIG